MKKLMIAALAVAMAAATQAASIKWAYTTTETSFNNATVYMIVGSTVPTEIEDWSAWLSGQTKIDKATGVIGYNAMTKKYTKTITATDSSITKDNDYYFIAVDSATKNFATSDVYGGSDIVYDLDEKETAKTTTLEFSDWTPIGKEEPEPTPEPTTGLLMLLGVAGLALRRKQA